MFLSNIVAGYLQRRQERTTPSKCTKESKRTTRATMCAFRTRLCGSLAVRVRRLERNRGTEARVHHWHRKLGELACVTALIPPYLLNTNAQQCFSTDVITRHWNRNIAKFEYLLPYYRNITAIWKIGFNTGIFTRILSVFDDHNDKNTDTKYESTVTLINIRTSCYSIYRCGFRSFIIVNLDQFFNNII